MTKRNTTVRTSKSSLTTRPAMHIAGMRMKIGVMGGAGPALTGRTLRLAHELGTAIATRDCILVTGACPGLPLAAADGAKRVGGIVVGISAALSLDEHIKKYRSPVEGHDVLIFTGSGLMGREVVNIRSSDIIVIVGGRSGTLGELAIAYDEGKLIGVLAGSGGITGLIPKIILACRKKTGARLIYDADPARLMDRLISEYEREHFRRPSCHMHDDVVSKGSGRRTARDPVCGMWVYPRRAAAHRSFDGTRYSFCSERCAKKFDSDPGTYAARDWRVG
jgi:uncharacterized protein (TIGR00725 family)